MKSFAFFLILIASCTSLAAPIAEEDVSHHLKARADDPGNPDGEPSYTDVTSGNSVEKSRIWPNIDPDEAKQRIFDWDESCSDENDRTTIYAAFHNMQKLVNNAMTLLDELKPNLPNQPVASVGNPNLDNVRYIFKEDPAYAQMFKGRDTGISYVRDSYSLLFQGSQEGAADRAASLRFICNKDNHVKEGDGKTPICDPTDQAITLIPQGENDPAIEQKYRFSTSSSITFCPAFFDDTVLPEFGNIKDTATSLAQLDCKERVMLHEFLHLPFTRNMKPAQDVIGYLNAANAAASLAWTSVRITPDNYAWYALYSWYNNRYRGCERDAWPAGTGKPNQSP